ncbi:FHA domain-containing protein [Bacteriovorax sp. PP10]|uniref:FHA domain-containing protein n=1 Tax=Bacteriovorax antarcticus TaxID=3088717 RepID=A0ABU5VZ44_9BACT|nr:FHA domain-containing protein [Bacteriovorax sp. PP10]MEA9358242.1 FHA domain-containing protein [Bacteriovorax sp. PP10]
MNNAHVLLKILISSPDKNETVSLEGEEFIFGRNSASTVHLNDPAFSRSHFKLVADSHSMKLVDMGSSNGTFINGVQASPVNAEAILNGDMITVTNSDIKITIVSIEREADGDATTILKYTPQQSLSEDSFGIDHLSQEIIKEANLRVEEIIRTAHIDAQEIILAAQRSSDKLIADKQAHADAYIEKQVVDKKTALKKELEVEKAHRLEDINDLFEIDRKNLYAELEDKAKKIESDHAKRREELSNELKSEIDKIQAKKVELKDLDKVFEAEVDKKKKDLDAQIATQKKELAALTANQESEMKKQMQLVDEQIATQKQELAALTANHEEEKKKQLQLMEAQFENKKFKLKEELDAVESKVAAAQKEFSSLYENYNTQKDTQVKTLEGLIAQKEQVMSEIKTLTETLANQKIQNAKFSADTRTQMDALQSEIDKIQKTKIEIENTYKTSKNSLTDLQLKVTETQTAVQKEDHALKQKKQELQGAEAELKKLAAEKDEIMSKLTPLKTELSELIRKNEAASRQNNDLRAEHNKEVTALKGNFLQMKKDLEEEMRKHKTAEEERLQNLTRHELNQINKIKADSLRIVLDLEDSITKELSNSTSKVFATTIGMTKFREIAPDFEKSIRASLQAGVLKLLQNELTPADPNKKKNLSSTQKSWKPMAIGLSIGAIVFGAIPLALQHVKDQNDPVRLQMEADARAAAAPPIKVFTPTKVNKLGATLVDSVIYTDQFYETVTMEKFRSGLMKEGSVYLYKQWKIDEEKSIQSYSMILSLIDVLHEKSGKIDPDFEKRDIGKMSAMEKETMKKLEKILGNEVRLEAAMKFQTRYYEDYVMNVVPAAAATN